MRCLCALIGQELAALTWASITQTTETKQICKLPHFSKSFRNQADPYQQSFHLTSETTPRGDESVVFAIASASWTTETHSSSWFLNKSSRRKWSTSVDERNYQPPG